MNSCLFYMPSFAGGGTERVYVLMAAHLAGMGWNVVVVVDRAEGPNRDFLPQNVAVQELGGSLLLSTIRLIEVLRTNKPHYIFCGGGISPLRMFFSSLGLRCRARVLVTYHSLYRRGLPLGRRLTYWSAPGLAKWFGRTVAVSESVRQQLLDCFRVPPARVVVVSNPVDVGLVRLQGESHDALVEKGPYIVTAGRLVEDKDYPTLLRAFAKVSSEIPHRLLVLGAGPLRNELQDMATHLGVRGRVVFTGYLHNPYPLIANADIFALSSRSEGFGNVLVEAMALGRKIVSTDCPGGPREILHGGAFGELVPVGDVDAFADALLHQVTHSVDQDALMARAMEFDVAPVVQRYLSLLGPLSGHN